MHAYELGALSSEKVRQFEIHIIDCEYCLNEVNEFTNHSKLLREDNDTRQAIKRTIREELPPDSNWEKIWRQLWPGKSLVFRPLLIYVVVILLLLMYSVHNIYMENSDNSIAPVQSVVLVSLRDSEVRQVLFDPTMDLVITIVFGAEIEDKDYNVSLINESGNILWNNEHYSGFDPNGIGSFLLPRELIGLGQYRIEITDSQKSILPAKYRFEIIE